MGNKHSVEELEGNGSAHSSATSPFLSNFSCKTSSPPSKSLYSYRFKHQAVGISCIFSRANSVPQILNRKRTVLRICVPNAPSYEFLRCCFRCNKDLQGSNIYIYRGEWSFCSVQCRNGGIEAKLGKQNVKSLGWLSKLETSRSQSAGSVIFFVGDEQYR